MSWQAYVDTHLVGTGKVHQAAIVGPQGGVWAASAGFNLTTEEVNRITKAFSSNEADITELRTSGIVLGGKKYFTLSADAGVVQLKKGPDGAVLYQTKQAILVAEYQSPVQQPECYNVVVGVANWLNA